MYESETVSQQSDEDITVTQPCTWDTSAAFDPASSTENDYFQEAPQEVAQYISKCFTKKLSADEQRKAAKQFKRPDINVMKITVLDTFFADKFPYTQKRDNELVDIQRQLLQSVGPLSILARKLAQGDTLRDSSPDVFRPGQPVRKIS